VRASAWERAKRLEPPSQIIVHVHLLDRTAIAEQQTLGVLGVNLTYGAFYLREDLPALL
jgi:hypothetical protein